MKKRVLVVAAHPDDEVLGCGGTVIKHAREGADVYTVILGESVTARADETRGRKATKERREKKHCVNKAAHILGVKKTFVFHFPDSRFDTIAILDIIKVIERVINEIRPDVVYTHHKDDLNIDHQRTFAALITACRPIKAGMVKEIYSFETPSSTEWNFSNTFSPNVYVDISGTMGRKIEAMKAYKDEIRKWPHPRSLEALELLARKRGCEVGMDLAEGFVMIRNLR